MVLVGRSAELRELDHLLDQALAGSGGLLTLVGGPGAGKTVLLGAVAGAARNRGFDVLAGAPVRGRPGRLVWGRLLRDAGASAEVTAAFLGRAAPLEVSLEIGRLVTALPRLIVIDDLDLGGDDAVDVLTVLATLLVASSTALVVTASAPLGVGPECTLRGLDAEELAAVVGDMEIEQRYAVWVASRGMPGAARRLAGQLSDLPAGRAPLVHLALNAVPRTEFLQVDDDLVRLLERALALVSQDNANADVRARLLARLSRELLGDPSAVDRRRELMDEALRQARNGGDPLTVAEVLDARLHALWDAAGAQDRLESAAEIVTLARAVGDERLERKGMLWRFIALMELARVDEAERALVAFERAAHAAGDAEDAVIALSRHAMLAGLRGRFAAVLTLADEVEDQGRRIGLPDLDRLVGAVRGAVIREQGEPSAAEAAVDVLYLLARRLPGHLYEATAARILSTLGRRDAAAAELQRLLPQAMNAPGPRWLGAITDLAVVAVDTGDSDAAAALYEALLPYRDRLVVWGGANATNGLVSHYLGLLAGRLGRPDQAVVHLEEAVRVEERIGALPALAHTLTALADALLVRDGNVARVTDVRQRGLELAGRLEMHVLLGSLTAVRDTWSLRQDGDGWLLEAGDERVRLADVRGLHYLRALLAASGRDVSALDLAAYRRRGTGLSGRVRRTTSEAERARVNVTRALRAAVTRVAARAPKAGAHLDASIRTGLACRYDPTPGGPSGWDI